VLVESPPLFLGLTAAFHRVVSHAPYLFHVADPWPDFPIAMGALNQPVARSVAFALERTAYRRAALVTTVTPGLVARLDRKPTAHGKVRLLANGVDLVRFDPEASRPLARRSLGWPEGPLTIAYVGSVGLAQGVGTLIDAVAPLAAEGVNVRMVGEGFEWRLLSESVRDRGLTHIHFDGAVAASEVPTVLAAADALVVMLKRGPLYEESLPTKLVEGLAAGRPLIVSAAGEAARLVDTASAGYVAPPEDVAGLRAAIRSFAADPDREAVGRRGRMLAAERFDRRAIVDQLAGYLEEVAASGSPSRNR
jgi:glycosyltransferase involved in cell wall biosynthesis